MEEGMLGGLVEEDIGIMFHRLSVPRMILSLVPRLLV